MSITDYIDPVAQTFLVPTGTYPNGMFVESIDIFFQSKDVNIPITLQIRPTQNGYPDSHYIIPFSEVTLSPYGKVDTITVDNGGSGYTGGVPNVTFSAPELSNGVQPTATAVLTGNQVTSITITNPGYGYTSAPTVTIAAPPSLGVTATATATITNYVKITDLSIAAKVATNFKFSSPVYLAPGEYAIVLISNSNKYNVYVSKIGELNITNVDQGQTISPQPYAGSFFKSQNASTWTAVQEEDLMFTINRCSFNQTTGTVTFNNNAMTAKSYHTFKSTSQEINFGNNKVSWKYKPSSDGTTLDSNYIDFFANSNTNVTSEKKVQSAGSFQLQATLTSDTDQISPVIDTERLSVIAVENIVNNISSVTTSTPGATGFISSSSIVYVNESQNFDNGDIIQIWNENMKITSGGGATGITGATGFVVERGYLGTGATAISGATGVNNISKDEQYKSGGGAFAKYITRRVTLTDGFDSTGLKIIMSTYTPTPSSVEVYYKILTTSDNVSFDEKPYIKMTEDIIAYNLNLDTQSKFIDRQFSAGLNGTSLTPFTVFSIKIVMKTTDRTVVPIIKDLRAIAVA